MSERPEHVAPVLGGPDEDAILRGRLAEHEAASAAIILRITTSTHRLLRDGDHYTRRGSDAIVLTFASWCDLMAAIAVERDAARRQVEALTEALGRIRGVAERQPYAFAGDICAIADAALAREEASRE